MAGSEALSTAFSPFTPVAPPADVLMLLQPAPIGWHRTVGIIGVGAAAAVAALRHPAAAGPRLAGVGAGIANGPDIADSVLGAALIVAAEVVEVVTNGPVNNEQPFLQPVATGPTNVGEAGAYVVLVAAVATGTLPSRPSSSMATMAGTTPRSVTRRLQSGTRVLICALPVMARPTRAGLSRCALEPITRGRCSASA